MEGKTGTFEVSFGRRKIPVTVTDDSRVADDWAKQQGGKLFGLHVKWNSDDNSAKNWNCFKRAKDKRPALLLLCGENGCLIVQLLYLNAPLATDSANPVNYVQPSSLRSLLGNSVIKLAGVGIQRTVDKLEQEYQLQCRGLIELQSFAARKFSKRKLRSASLEKLAIRILDLSDLKKSKNATLFSWAERELYPFQVVDATVDAFLSFAIAKTLLES